jgi:redox-sensitive bicupin YhaK (pirin superfamily)
VWDVRLRGGRSVSLQLPDGHNAAIAVLKGKVTVNGSKAGHADLVVLDRSGEGVRIESAPGDDAVFLLLSGEPIAEPVVGYGPFVMNSRLEIEAAMNDFRMGKFGKMPPQDVAPRVDAAAASAEVADV